MTPRERRIVAVGLLVGAVAAVWLLGVNPILQGFADRDAERQSLLLAYARNARLLEAAPLYRTEVQDLVRTGPKIEITAPSQSAAIDALKQRLSTALIEGGGTVTALQEAQGGRGADRVAVRADAAIPYPALVQALRRLENETPYVVVDYVSVGAEQALKSGHAGPLDVRLQVSALFRPAPVR